jgi:hypothetical protein
MRWRTYVAKEDSGDDLDGYRSSRSYLVLGEAQTVVAIVPNMSPPCLGQRALIGRCDRRREPKIAVFQPRKCQCMHCLANSGPLQAVREDGSLQIRRDPRGAFPGSRPCRSHQPAISRLPLLGPAGRKYPGRPGANHEPGSWSLGERIRRSLAWASPWRIASDPLPEALRDRSESMLT